MSNFDAEYGLQSYRIMKNPVVFIVEKNTYHGNLVKYHLQANRFQDVRVFSNSEECLLAMSRGIIPDFIISDTHSGKISGTEFLGHILESAPGARVIFFSASADESLATQLLEKGASDYIQTTNKGDAGIRELIKNLQFIYKEAFHSE